jgi:hypothetical protein
MDLAVHKFAQRVQDRILKRPDWHASEQFFQFLRAQGGLVENLTERSGPKSTMRGDYDAGEGFRWPQNYVWLLSTAERRSRRLEGSA